VYDIYNMVKQKKPQKVVDENAIAKSITILPKHQRFIEARSLNLSKFVQKKLDEEIDLQGWKE
jgi:sulfur relay (sulfurtransferase) DsrF/TusC family protein